MYPQWFTLSLLVVTEVSGLLARLSRKLRRCRGQGQTDGTTNYSILEADFAKSKSQSEMSYELLQKVYFIDLTNFTYKIHKMTKR